MAFEIDGAVIDLLYCHCAMCRKAHGSAFRARGKVKASQLRWTRGEDLIRYFESSPGTHRGFCSVCGSNLASKFDQNPKILGLALGVLDDDPGNRPICHVYVGSKAPWHEITDPLPQFEELPSEPIMTPPFDPQGFAQRQLDAYNARDLERFIREYTEDVTVYRLPDTEPVIVGRAALAAHYRDNRFNLPELHAKLVNRMVFGNKVIDQELVTGVPGAPLEVAAIYEVTEQGISKVWFVNSR